LPLFQIGELERQLAYEQRNHTSSTVELKELHVRIEGLKRKVRTTLLEKI
jgi:hypothetical protein